MKRNIENRNVDNKEGSEERERLLKPNAYRIDGEEDEVDKRRNLYVKYAKLILPHVGLILLAGLYVVLGATVFYHIERPNESKIRQSNLDMINRESWQFLTNLDSLTLENETGWNQSVMINIENITDILLAAFDTNYVTSGHLLSTSTNNNSAPSSNETGGPFTWTFRSALFFTVTLLTTIGYGNIVPVTFEGRLFCICYGLFGVPLILITVADIGKFLAEHITAIYLMYVKWKRSRNFARRKNALNGFSNSNSSACDQNQTQTRKQSQGRRRRKAASEEIHNLVANIPTPLILLILLTYMLIGAALVSSVEKWSFLDGTYFSFISLTTIGFGDLVPEDDSYYLLHMLYLIIGLSMTTMCIDLVGARYIEKIHYFGMAIKDARYALVNVGGQLVKVRDLKKCAIFLHRKYGGAGKNPIKNIRSSAERESLNWSKQERRRRRTIAKFPEAFTPNHIGRIKYIDFVSSTESLRSVESQSIQQSEENENDKKWRETYGLV